MQSSGHLQINHPDIYNSIIRTPTNQSSGHLQINHPDIYKSNLINHPDIYKLIIRTYTNQSSGHLQINHPDIYKLIIRTYTNQSSGHLQINHPDIYKSIIWNLQVIPSDAIAKRREKCVTWLVSPLLEQWSYTLAVHLVNWKERATH